MSFKLNLHPSTSGDMGFMAEAYIRDSARDLRHPSVTCDDKLWEARWSYLWSLSISLQAFRDGLYYSSSGPKDKFPVNPHRYKK